MCFNRITLSVSIVSDLKESQVVTSTTVGYDFIDFIVTGRSKDAQRMFG